LGYGWSIRHRGLPESALSASKVGWSEGAVSADPNGESTLC
jgi:hypothetical protein